MSDYSKSTYVYEIVDEVLCIADQDSGGMSVTNNAEQVLEEVRAALDSHMPPIVIYRDTQGNWDGMNLNKTGMVEFYPLRTDNRRKAIVKAKAMFREANHGRPQHD